MDPHDDEVDFYWDVASQDQILDLDDCVRQERLLVIVDEKAGGIIAYCVGGDVANEIIEALRAARGPAAPIRDMSQ